MDKLTKENFWDDLYSRYPKEMQVFCNWIDEYKKRVGWKELFYTPHTPAGRDIKYHDLPVAMQIGIFIQFTFETPKRYHFLDLTMTSYNMDSLVNEIKEWFSAEKHWKSISRYNQNI